MTPRCFFRLSGDFPSDFVPLSSEWVTHVLSDSCHETECSWPLSAIHQSQSNANSVFAETIYKYNVMQHMHVTQLQMKENHR